MASRTHHRAFGPAGTCVARGNQRGGKKIETQAGDGVLFPTDVKEFTRRLASWPKMLKNQY